MQNVGHSSEVRLIQRFFAADFGVFGASPMWITIRLAEYFSANIRLNKIRRLYRLSAAAWGSVRYMSIVQLCCLVVNQVVLTVADKLAGPAGATWDYSDRTPSFRRLASRSTSHDDTAQFHLSVWPPPPPSPTHHNIPRFRAAPATVWSAQPLFRNLVRSPKGCRWPSWRTTVVNNNIVDIRSVEHFYYLTLSSIGGHRLPLCHTTIRCCTCILNTSNDCVNNYHSATVSSLCVTPQLPSSLRSPAYVILAGCGVPYFCCDQWLW